MVTGPVLGVEGSCHSSGGAIRFPWKLATRALRRPAGAAAYRGPQWRKPSPRKDGGWASGSLHQFLTFKTEFLLPEGAVERCTQPVWKFGGEPQVSILSSEVYFSSLQNVLDVLSLDMLS